MTEAEAGPALAMEPLASPPPGVGSGGVLTTAGTTGMTKTPPRNNYASQHTPIASIKRPRSSIEQPSQNTTPKRSSAGMTTPSESALSPLHPPTAVVRDTKAVEEKIFSPVLHWDGHEEEDEEEDRHRHDPLTHDSHSTSTSTARKVSDNDDDCCDDNLSSHSDASLSVTEMDVDDEFNPWQFIKSLPPYSHVAHLTPPVNLPPIDANRFDLTLVLDLDETLVHCTVEVCDDADFVFPVLFHGMEYQVYVRLRPHLFEFLKRIQGLKFETVIFTASQKVYADELLNRIDPERKFFHHRLFRESCLPVEGNFLKDLTVLGRDLSKTVLVDNSPHAFGYQLDNGIPIESWFDNPSDRELLKLERFLRQLSASAGTVPDSLSSSSPTDVRDLCRRKFQLVQRVRDAPEYAG